MMFISPEQNTINSYMFQGRFANEMPLRLMKMENNGI